MLCVVVLVAEHRVLVAEHREVKMGEIPRQSNLTPMCPFVPFDTQRNISEYFAVHK